MRDRVVDVRERHPSDERLPSLDQILPPDLRRTLGVRHPGWSSEGPPQGSSKRAPGDPCPNLPTVAPKHRPRNSVRPKKTSEGRGSGPSTPTSRPIALSPLPSAILGRSVVSRARRRGLPGAERALRLGLIYIPSHPCSLYVNAAGTAKATRIGSPAYLRSVSTAWASKKAKARRVRFFEGLEFTACAKVRRRTLVQRLTSAAMFLSWRRRVFTRPQWA